MTVYESREETAHSGGTKNLRPRPRGPSEAMNVARSPEPKRRLSDSVAERATQSKHRHLPLPVVLNDTEQLVSNLIVPNFSF